MSNGGQNNGLGMIFAFFTGFMAGAVISLLYAPNSGRETRQKIRDKSVEARDRTVELAHQASDNARQSAQNLMEQSRESVQGIVDTSKERLQEAGDQVKSAMEAGRKVSADVRTKIAGSIPSVGGADEANEEATEEA